VIVKDVFGSEHEVNGGTSLHILLVRERARLRDPSSDLGILTV